VLAAGVFMEAYTLIVVNAEGDLALPPNFGNFERVRALLADDGKNEEFSFAVVGDTRQGTETFEQICEKLKDEPLSFMVLLGDCVRSGKAGYHRFLKCEWAKEPAMSFPVFYVVGNHDVDREEFPISEFEKIYGPTNFCFDYSGCLFIVLRILPNPYATVESLEFLETVLSVRRDDYDKVFVFMHVPPRVPDFSARKFKYQKQFVSLIDRYHVDYVITGDYHGYARVKSRDTVYLITGGGGANLEDRKFGKFHHAIVIKVGADSISERVLVVNSRLCLEDRAEELAFGEIYPWLKDNWVAAVLLNAGILGILFWTCRSFLWNRPICKVKA
jgi:hypothetical protein